MFTSRAAGIIRFTLERASILVSERQPIIRVGERSTPAADDLSHLCITKNSGRLEKRAAEKRRSRNL